MISAFRELGLSDFGQCAAVISACGKVISACFRLTRPVTSAYTAVISVCGEVISAYIHMMLPSVFVLSIPNMAWLIRIVGTFAV